MPEYLFGRHAVLHLIKAHRRPVHRLFLLKGSERVDDPIVAAAEEARIPIDVRPPTYFEKFDRESHQGVIAETEAYPYTGFSDLIRMRFLLLCDSLQDPQNLGAICRTALLLGVEGVSILENRASPVTGVVCKAAAGAVEYLKIARVTSLAQAINLLKDNGFWIYGADQSAEKNIYQEHYSGKVALVIGGEGEGLSRLVKERCDILVKIPMASKEIGSYNAATAAALILAEISHQIIQIT